MLLDFVNENLLLQLVEGNTRHQKDLVFTNNDDLISNVNVDTNNYSYDTDHDTVTCQVLLTQPNSVLFGGPKKFWGG